MREILNINHTQSYPMKNIIKLIVGATMQMAAAPVIVTGRSAQAVGHFTTKTGESIELTGLRMDDAGEGKRLSAKGELSKSRAERAAMRAQKRSADKSTNAHYRKTRIAQLETIKKSRQVVDEMAAAGSPSGDSDLQKVAAQMSIVPAN